MRALQATRTGSELVDLAPPVPGPGEIRLEMIGAGTNQADLNVLADPGRYGARLGMDVAGIVDQVGPGVTGFTVGDRVAALTMPPRSAAEYVVVPAGAAGLVPDGFDLLDAATVPLNALTADQLLGLLDGWTGRLLVTGAAGGIGGYAVPLAARASWNVTALARATDQPFLTEAGAGHTLTTLDDARGFDGVLDTAKIGPAALSAVRDGGIYVGVFPGQEPSPERGITVVTGIVHPDGPRLTELLELSAKGGLITRRGRVVKMADATDVYTRLRAGGVRGRDVLVP